MLKKNSIVKFVLLVIIAVLGVLLCVCPFNVPGSSDRYNGFVAAINKGIDINGGVSALYSATASGSLSDLENNIDDSLSKIRSLLKLEGYSEVNVTRQGSDKVRIEVSDDAYDTSYNWTYLENGKEIEITIDQVSDTVTDARVYLSSQDIKSAYISYGYDSNNNGRYEINLELTKNGQSRLKNMKNDADEAAKSNAYVYLGGLAADNLLSTLTIDDIDENIVIVSSHADYSSTSAENMQELIYTIVAGSLGYDMTLMETSIISPALGQNTALYLTIVSILIAVLSLLFIIIRYRHLGLLGCLSIIFGLVLFAFFMQAIPFITLNIATMFGCVVAFAIMLISNIIIFEKVRSEYAIGKKIHLSFKGGLKKALWPILDSHFILLIAGIMIWIFAPSVLKGFAIATVIGVLLSAFCSLVLTRYFMHLYLPINSTNAAKLSLYRDKSVRELSSEEVEILPEESAAEFSVEGGANNE